MAICRLVAMRRSVACLLGLALVASGGCSGGSENQPASSGQAQETRAHQQQELDLAGLRSAADLREADLGRNPEPEGSECSGEGSAGSLQFAESVAQALASCDGFGGFGIVEAQDDRAARRVAVRVLDAYEAGLANAGTPQQRVGETEGDASSPRGTRCRVLEGEGSAEEPFDVCTATSGVFVAFGVGCTCADEAGGRRAGRVALRMAIDWARDAAP